MPAFCHLVAILFPLLTMSFWIMWLDLPLGAPLIFLQHCLPHMSLHSCLVYGLPPSLSQNCTWCLFRKPGESCICSAVRGSLTALMPLVLASFGKRWHKGAACCIHQVALWVLVTLASKQTNRKGSALCLDRSTFLCIWKIPQTFQMLQISNLWDFKPLHISRKNI